MRPLLSCWVGLVLLCSSSSARAQTDRDSVEPMPLGPLAKQPSQVEAAPAPPLEFFQFKGVPLGATLSSTRSVLPPLKCSSHGFDISVGDMSCAPEGWDEARGDYGTYAAINPRYWALFFYRGELSFVRVVFLPAYFETIVGALEAKYGKPSHVGATMIQTKSGVSFENTTYTWENSGSLIEVSRYFDNINNGVVVYTLKSYAKEAERIGKEQTKKAAGDL
jgi:hypothetical protein